MGKSTDSSKRDISDLIELLAAKEHERWAHWQRYMHGCATTGANGELTFPAEIVARWERQISTPYEDLPDAEKQSDRDQVMNYLPLLEEWFLTKVTTNGSE